MKLNHILTSICWVLLPMLSWAGEKGKPNIVFIISDQHKKAALACYGDDLAITPHLDALAATGVMLNNCYAAAPVCAPSRAALTTGMYPASNGAPYHKAPIMAGNGQVENVGTGRLRQTGYHESLTTLPDIFRQNGFVTGSPGKMHVHGELQKKVDPMYPEGNDMGYDEANVRYYTHFPGGHYQDEVGRDAYERYRIFGKYIDLRRDLNLNTTYLPSLVENDEDNFDMVVTRKSIEFIEARAKDGKNFFLHVGLEKPHPPFTTTQKYLDMYNPENFELPETVDAFYGKGKFPWVPDWIHNDLGKQPDKARNSMAAYYACVTEVDDMVGRIVQSLKENDLYENTIIIYTSDHGEHLLEHGLRGKHCMYEAAINIPFIISYPKLFPENTTNDILMSLVDLMPTFCDLMGWEIPETAEGMSVLPALTSGSEIPRRRVFAEFRGHVYKAFPDIRNLPSRMMRIGDYKFIYTHGMINQLYQMEEDPNEMRNLAFEPEFNEKQRDWCFQTLAGWHPQQYQLLWSTLTINVLEWQKEKDQQRSAVKSFTLRWQAYEQAANYVVFHAKTSDPYTAKPIAIQLQSTELKVYNQGFYWVMAEPEFTRTVQRFDERPVLVAQHTYQLPITAPVQLSR